MDDEGKQYSVGVAMTKDSTAIFFYNYNEVNRSNIMTGIVTNVTVGQDRFYLKVHQLYDKTSEGAR